MIIYDNQSLVIVQTSIRPVRAQLKWSFKCSYVWWRRTLTVSGQLNWNLCLMHSEWTGRTWSVCRSAASPSTARPPSRCSVSRVTSSVTPPVGTTWRRYVCGCFCAGRRTHLTFTTVTKQTEKTRVNLMHQAVRCQTCISKTCSWSSLKPKLGF